MKATPAELTGLPEDETQADGVLRRAVTVYQNGAASEEGYSMRFKARKPIRKLRPPVNLVEPGDILLCYELAKNLPADRVKEALFAITKFGWIANARVLAKAGKTQYQILVNVLDEESATSVRQNLAEHPDIVPCEVPAGRGDGFVPWGHVLPSGVQEEIALRIASDADIEEFDAAMTARRMDQFPGEEFLFPDLSPEEYARVKKAPKPS
jgi:hypothetical protein